jgi:Flp pilus assembly protein TadD
MPHQVPHAAQQANSQALGARMRQALEDGGEGVDLAATDRAALARAADRLFAARRFDDAIPVYRRILELQPDDAETRNDLGLALHYTGDSQSAIAMLQEGTELAPEFQRAWLSLGFVALQAGEFDIARDALARAHRIGPETEIGREATRLLALLDDAEGSS